MKAFKVTINITEKQNFTKEGLKNAILNDLAELQLSLINFEYYNGTCECVIEYKDFGIVLPYHQLVLGGIQGLSIKYPHFDINSINPEFIEV